MSTAVRALLSQLAVDDHGAVSPSVYETGRLVRTARWLDGHSARLNFLVRTQHRDGSWGASDGYGLVPTLSATEALISELHRPVPSDGDTPSRSRLVDATTRGLHTLFGWLGTGRLSLPDTIGVELVVPWLVAEINGHLHGLADRPVPGLDAWRGAARLALPPDLDDAMLWTLRGTIRAGQALPEKLWHSMETLGADVRHLSSVEPTNGSIGCSPAATAAWLAARTPHANQAPVRYLEAVQARHGGPVPGVTPITVFERAWVLFTLASAGVKMAVPPSVIGHLGAALGELGAPAGIGLPPDSDDTAGALYALAAVGSPRSVDCLWAYEGDSYFRCFLGELTPSTSTNAHILDALIENATSIVGARRRAATRKISRWLLDQQNPDGSWWDKWHASPYYATMCCASALARTDDSTVASSLRRAVTWTIDTQHADGSWGRWAGTVEETAYAVQVLLRAGATEGDDATARAVARGCAWLLQQPDTDADHPPLWHDKDLYAPIAVVRAARIAALHLAAARPDIRRLAGSTDGVR